MAIESLLLGSTVGAVLLIGLATIAIWIASGWLEESAEVLSGYYGLPAVIQGSIVVAIGSSFPEFSSVIFTSLTGSFDMGVGAIVGSAIFNVLVIPALSGLATEDDLAANRAIVYKEAQFYMVAVSAIIVTFALAVIYVPVAGGSELLGEITRPLAAIPLSLYGLYLFIQWQEVGDQEMPPDREGVALRWEWGKLLAGLVAILIAVERLVAGVESIAITLSIPEFLAGVTIIAAATSLPDALVSIRSARDENGLTSLGNVLGSNTFDLLVAIPTGVLIVGTVTVDFAVAAPMMGVLTLATVLLFTLLRTDLSVSDRESYLLLVAYGLFVAWVVAETIGLTELLHTA
ncbi:sodium:calcium antiporter [Halopenitus sp. H-Gu1]|uniref:sodium:calcium antiporter n=1 Tax=Halopenitus sp. H-Gu1 TaxID=3242697 RepID=UPI00359D8B00